MFGPKLEVKCGGYSKMKEHSKKVRPIAVPVWLIMKPAISPPFIVTPKHRKKTNGLFPSNRDPFHKYSSQEIRRNI